MKGYDKKKALTPKLRFPEFREGAAWVSERMGKLYSFRGSNAHSRDKLNYESGSVKNIHYGDIHTKFPALFDIAEESVPYINPTEQLPPYDSGDYCVEGDLIFADASEDTNDVGKSIEIVRLRGQRLLSGQHTILARRNDDRLIVGFGGYLFRSGRIRSQIQKEAQGTKVYSISATRMGNVDIAFPGDEKEQQKIADCMAALDDVIAAQGRRVEALKTHKKGLMQHLFPRDGENIPRLRFPEFRKAPAWEERLAGQLFLNRTAEGEEGLPVYSVTMTNGLVKRSSLERRVDDIAEAHGNKKAFKNEIVYNMMRMWQGASGVALEDCMVSPAYVVLVPQAGAHSHFFAFLLKLPRYLRLLASHSQGLTKDRLRLYYKDFARIPLLSPGVREQEKIANLLSSIDSLITVDGERLEALKTHQKGLMQQLFPSLEEVEA